MGKAWLSDRPFSCRSTTVDSKNALRTPVLPSHPRQRDIHPHQRAPKATARIKPDETQPERRRTEDMFWIPGGTFRMGSDNHYAEEAPSHRVSVDGFWIDRTPVTNRQFKEFVNATGHVTTAQIVPDPKDYPGALPKMIYAGSLVFSPSLRVTDLRDWSQWWTFMKGANWRHPYGPRSNINQGTRRSPCRACLVRRRAHLRALGRQGPSHRSRVGVCRSRRPRRRGIRLGQ
jgi:formylglycine-generating enzyme required for sulfatase activity